MKTTWLLVVLLTVYLQTAAGLRGLFERRVKRESEPCTCEGEAATGQYYCNTCQNEKGACTEDSRHPTLCQHNKEQYCKRTWKENKGAILFEKWMCATPGQCHYTEEIHLVPDGVRPGNSPVLEQCFPADCKCTNGGNTGNGKGRDPSVTGKDDCKYVVCQNGGTCIDGWKEYTCNCVPGYTGKHCETIMNCGHPGCIQHGTMSSNDNELYNFGSTVTYNCDAGYKLVGVHGTRTCVLNGDQSDVIWSGEAPTCDIMNCGYPGGIDHGTVSSNDNELYNFGSTVTYSCIDGYKLEGAQTRLCQATSNGVSWNPAQPSCTIRNCGDPPTSDGVVYTGNTFYGGTITYKCTTAGYILRGSETNSCDADANEAFWKETIAPTCRLPPQVITCDPLTVQHGSATEVGTDKQNNELGTVMSVTCDSGYELFGGDGSGMTECKLNADGDANWTPGLYCQSTTGPCAIDPCITGEVCQNINATNRNCLTSDGSCSLTCSSPKVAAFVCQTCFNNKGPCGSSQYKTTVCGENKDGYCKRNWKTDNGASDGTVTSEKWECATDGQCHLNEDIHVSTSPGGSKVFERCTPGECTCSQPDKN